MTENYQPVLQTDMRDPRTLSAHKDNPRGDIDENSLEITQLADDVRKRGIIQPVVITPDGKVLAGHRRRIASIIAGLELIPVVIRELKKGEFAEDFFLAENMQRQDLSPLEEARAISNLQTKLEKQTKRKVPVTEIARRINLSIPVVRERLVILEFPERVQQLFHQADIPLGSATKLYKLREFPDEIIKFADRMATRQITLASLDALIARRLPELQKLAINEAVVNRHEKLSRINHHYPENHHSPLINRASAIESLTKNSSAKISLHTVLSVLERTCCNCGMMGNDAVCLSCPLPKFVNGIVGRADSN